MTADIDAAGIGGEDTLQRIYDLEAFEAIDPTLLRTTLYFDPYSGDDSNDGSEESPFQTYEKVKEVCGTYTHCIAKGAFARLTLTLTSQSGTFDEGERLTVGGVERAEIVGIADGVAKIAAGGVFDTAQRVWTDASSGTFTLKYNGQRTGNIAYNADAATVQTALNALRTTVSFAVTGAGTSGDPWLITPSGFASDTVALPVRSVSDALVGGDLFLEPSVEVSDVITGVDSGATATVSAIVDTVGGGDAFLFTSLDAAEAHAQRIVALWSGPSHADPAVIHCNYTGTFSSGAVFGAQGTGFGWLGVENWRVVGCARDTIGNEQDGRIVALNVEAQHVVQNESGNNNVITSHSDGEVVGLNVTGNSLQDSAGGNGSPIAPTATAGLTLISNGLIRTDGTANHTSGTVASSTTGGVVRIIGPTISTGALPSIGIAVQTNNKDPIDMMIARVTALGGTSGSARCFSVATGLSTAPTSMSLYQSQCVRGARALQIVGAATGPASLFARGFSAVGILNHLTAGSSPAQVALYDVDIQESIYDDDEAGNQWSIGGSTFATLAEAQAMPEVVAAGYELFTNSLGSGGPTVNATQWEGDPDFRCDPGRECWASFESEYTVPFHRCLPRDVLGTELCGLRLNQTGDGNIGGR